MRIWIRGMSVVALAVLVVGASAQTPYTVKPGETLFSIARERLGDVTRWREIFELNKERLESPDQVKADMVLMLPSRGATAPAPAAAATPARSAAPAPMPAANALAGRAPLVHVLQAEETLGSVALKYLGAASRWPEIYELNKDRIADPNRVQAGTVLRLPANAVRPTASAPTASAPTASAPTASAAASAPSAVPTPAPVTQLGASSAPPSAAAAAMAAAGSPSPAASEGTVAAAAEPSIRPITDAQLRRTVDEIAAEEDARAAAEAEAREEAARQEAARAAAERDAAARRAAEQEEAVRAAAARAAEEADARAAADREAAERDAAAREAEIRAAAEREAAAQEEAHRQAAARMAANEAHASSASPTAVPAPPAPTLPQGDAPAARSSEARTIWEEAQRELAAARARSGQAGATPDRPQVEVSYAPQNPAAPESRGTQGEDAAVMAEARRQAASAGAASAEPVPVAASTARPAAASPAASPRAASTPSRTAAPAATGSPTAPPAWKKVYTQSFAMRSGGEDARQYQALIARELQRRWQQSGNWAGGPGVTDYLVMGEYWTRGNQLVIRVDIQRGFTIAKSLQWTVPRSELVEGGAYFERMASEINQHLR